jgi:hypothetical protein
MFVCAVHDVCARWLALCNCLGHAVYSLCIQKYISSVKTSKQQRLVPTPVIPNTYPFNAIPRLWHCSRNRYSDVLLLSGQLPEWAFPDNGTGVSLL